MRPDVGPVSADALFTSVYMCYMFWSTHWYTISRKTCLLQAKFFDTFDGHTACPVHQKMAIAAGEPRYSG